ncbi:MAG: M3 family oligoendopeptidase [Alphaproteobacteria bacterium]|nr:M3 family oligoendopeptidase [Alphaproteobacteria bacterium]
MPDAAAPATDQGKLPRWNLDDLFPGPDSAELEQALVEADSRTRAFAGRYRERVATLDGAELGAAIAEYEAIDEVIGRIISYASLRHAADLADPGVGRFWQSTQERVTTISSDIVFFTLELNRIDDATLATLLADPAAARWQPWLRDIRAWRAHQLSDELERFLHEKHVAGRAAWERLFDETMAALRFTVEVGGQTRELPIAATLDLLSDRDGATRERAGRALATGLTGNLRLFAHITNTLAKDKAIEDAWRHFARPVSARNLSNTVEDAVVEALIEAVRGAYPRLSHRYYRLKSKWLGTEKLKWWDRNAPLPQVAERRLDWNDARALVLDAYRSFAPPMADAAARFFDGSWIDAEVRAGKSPGAFSHSTVPSVHPYILLNYQGRPRDVMTLAHELGHGVHQVMAGSQGHLMSQTPLTLAETASVFGEMLAFHRLLSTARDKAERRSMLAGKVEDMLNTVVRQVAFYEFERRLHDRRREGELLAEEICTLWLEVQHESLGPSLAFDNDYKVFWTYIPHFIHSPFYVYAYAFGDCLVNALWVQYEEHPQGFADKYLAMLAAGGRFRHRELLAPFGLDATDPKFWERGLAVPAGMIDELEAMED